MLGRITVRRSKRPPECRNNEEDDNTMGCIWRNGIHKNSDNDSKLSGVGRPSFEIDTNDACISGKAYFIMWDGKAAFIAQSTNVARWHELNE